MFESKFYELNPPIIFFFSRKLSKVLPNKCTPIFCDKTCIYIYIYIWSNCNDQKHGQKHDRKPQMVGLVREIPGYFKQDLGLVKYYSTWPDIQFLPLAGFCRGKKWKAFFAGFQPPPELLKLMEVWVGWSPPRDPVT